MFTSDLAIVAAIAAFVVLLIVDLATAPGHVEASESLTPEKASRAARSVPSALKKG